MKISFAEQFFMSLRKSPIRKIKKALNEAEKAGIEISVQQAEAHSLAGGDIEKVVEALVLAKQKDVVADFMTLTTVDLTDNDPISAVEKCTADLAYDFSTYFKDSKEPIRGFCKDGTEVFAKCKIRYRNPVSHIFGDRIPLVQENISARIAILINTSDDLKSLEMRTEEHSTVLLPLAKRFVEPVKKIELAFSRH